MRRKSITRIESALQRIKGISDDNEVYPDPSEVFRSKPSKVYKKEFKSNSTIVIAIHFLKSVISPSILNMPFAFENGGLTFSIFGYLTLLSIVTYNMMRLIKSASYLSDRENANIRTYDEVAYFSFFGCSTSTRRYAKHVRVFVNVLFIFGYLDNCSICMIFIARNLEAIISYFYPNVLLNVYHFLFFQVLVLMIICSIRNLQYIAPLSFISCLLILIVAGLTFSFYLIPNLSNPFDQKPIGSIYSIPRFTSIVLFSLSGLSIALTLKSSMKHPEKFFSCPGVFWPCMSLMSILFLLFGYFGCLAYREQVLASIMLNLPVNKVTGLTIKGFAIVGIFLAAPLLFYIAFNVLWNNYLKPHVNPVNVMFAEFFVRYNFILLSFLMASSVPDLQSMVILKGALIHSHLEITIPALLEYLVYYPEKQTGRYHWRLIKTVFICTFGSVLSVSGTFVAIRDLVINGIPDAVISVV